MSEAPIDAPGAKAASTDYEAHLPVDVYQRSRPNEMTSKGLAKYFWPPHDGIALVAGFRRVQRAEQTGKLGSEGI